MFKCLRWAVVVVFALVTLRPLAAQPSCSPNTDFTGQGLSSLSAGAYADAIAALSCAIRSEPANYIAYLARYEAAFLGGGDLDQAMDDFDLVYRQAQALALDAVNRYTTAVQQQPDSTPHYRMRAYAYWRSAQDQLAMLDYERIITLAPDDFFGYLFRGSSNFYLGNRAGAEADFEAALTRPNAVVYRVIGVTYLDTARGLERDGDPAQAEPLYREAITYLDQAIALNPNRARSYANRGLAHAALGSDMAALADLDRAVAVFPDELDLLFARGRVNDRLGNDAAAVDDLTRILDLDPQNVEGYQLLAIYWRANAYLGLRQYETAIAEFTRVFDLDMMNNADLFAGAYLGRGLAYELLGNAASAAAEHGQYVRFLNRGQFSEAGTVAAGQTVTLAMTDRTVFHLTFQASAGQTLNLRAQSPDGSVDPLLVLFSGERAIASRDDIDLTNYNAVIDGFVAPTAGTYDLYVTHGAGGSLGAVVLSLE